MEQFRKIIREYILTEIANLEYDLEKWYDHWNRKLFGGNLDPVRLRYSNMKQLGKTKAFIHKNGRRVTDVDSIEWLAISKMYEMPEEVFHATLIHEMIHVYMLQNFEDFTWLGGYHGEEFRKFASDLSQESGYDIAVQHDLYQNELPVRGEGKETIVVIIRKGREPNAWGLRPNAWNSETKNKVFDFLERYNDWEIIRTSSPAVKQITRSRKVPRKLKFTPVSESAVDRFRQSGEIIATE